MIKMNRLKSFYYKIPDTSVKQEGIIRKLVNIFGAIFILFAIVACTYILLVNRALWVDEAMLAYSLITRSITELTSRALDNVQSAPIIYLYIVKIITLIFGHSEISLRIFSFISYLCTLYLVFYNAKHLLKIKYPILPVAFCAVLWIMIRFSGEFKPYMTDAMLVLSVLLVGYLRKQCSINFISFVALFAGMVWFSNPVCFMIGAILIFDFVEAVKTKNKKFLQETLLTGIGVILSFVIYYFYWLKPVIDTGLMQRFWGGKSYPLIPITDLERYHFVYLLRELMQYFGRFSFIVGLVILLGLPFNIFYFKNRYINIIYTCLFITLFVSSLGMFPIEGRMCLFFYPLLALLFFFYLSQLFTQKNVLNLFVLAFSFAVIFSAFNIQFFFNKENIYMQEMGQAIDFLENTNGISAKDLLYIPNEEEGNQYVYEKDYDLKQLEYKVMIGHGAWWSDEDLHEGELEQLINSTKEGNLYIVTKYGESFLVLDSLAYHGNNVEQIYDKYDKKIYKVSQKN